MRQRDLLFSCVDNPANGTYYLSGSFMLKLLDRRQKVLYVFNGRAIGFIRYWKHFGWHWICFFYIYIQFHPYIVCALSFSVYFGTFLADIDEYRSWILLCRLHLNELFICASSNPIECGFMREFHFDFVSLVTFFRIVNHINYLLSFWLNVPICCLQ